MGAGNHQWVNQTAKYVADLIRNVPALRDAAYQFHVYVIGIGAEQFTGGSESVDVGDRCTACRFGAFCIENLEDELPRRMRPCLRKNETPIQIDLAVSRWCFRHLCDPAGTLQQVHNMLRGWFLMDGFLVDTKDDDNDNDDESPLTTNWNRNMTQLMLTLEPHSLLTHYYDCTRSLNHFAMTKNTQ